MKKSTAFAILTLVVLTMGAPFVCGCGQLKDEARAAAKSVVDCTTTAATAALTEYGPTVEQVIVDAAQSDGKLDWERVKSATKSYASDAARCVLATTVARLMKSPAASPGAPQSATLWLEPIALARGWEAMRAEQLAGAKFKLSEGTL